MGVVKERTGKTWFCNVCKLDCAKSTEHCDDCQVCINDYDHHCVFFSKCIGGGNIYPFWGSMAGIVVNFGIIVVILCLTGFQSRPSIN